MTERYGMSPEDYQDAIGFRRDRAQERQIESSDTNKETSELMTLEPGDEVVVPRSSGELDKEGWKIKSIYKDTDGTTWAVVQNQGIGAIKKIEYNELMEYN